MSKHQYIIENSNAESNSVILTLKPKNIGDSFNFKPGQYAMLSFHDSAGKLFIDHPFSIASSPTKTNGLRFGIRILGKFTQNLPRLKNGEGVDVMGPFGDFIFDENKYQDVVFLAGGVGITPFISAIEYASDKELPNKINLLYSNRTVKDTLFYEDIKRFAEINPNFKPKIKITQEQLAAGVPYCENGYVTKETILENVGSVVDKNFFICGPAPFMKAMNENLVGLGVPASRIHQEAFNNTPNLTFRKNYKNIFSVYGATAILFIIFLSFVGIKFKSNTNSSGLTPLSNNVANGGTPISLINNTVNDRRNSIIGTKQLLSNTISAGSGKVTKTTVAPNATQQTVANTPAQQVIVAPAVQQPIVQQPAVAPVAAPVTAPRTRVS